MIKQIHNFFRKNPATVKIIEKITGSKMLVKLPLGLDPILDIKYSVPNIEIKTIIDVGSNIGQSENYFFKSLPKSNIYCIEPVLETFKALKENIKGLKTKSFNIGLGEKKEIAEMQINKNLNNSVSNSLTNSTDLPNENFYIQEVKIETLTDFCNQNELKHINFLKIDTEGYDLKVLKGGENLLSNQKVDFIQVEVSMNPFNTFHVSFDEVNKYLDFFDYYIFGIYDQIHDFKLKEPILRRSNIIYISKACLKNIPTTKTKLH